MLEAAMDPLTPSEITTRLTSLTGWTEIGGVLTRTFVFSDFVASLGFVNRIGEAAERAAHHPDIDIRYNRVRIALVTHDVGGITAKDFDLGEQIEKLT
jgi:4a-hydroxytetrahydrobiopterin dehydratase